MKVICAFSPPPLHQHRRLCLCPYAALETGAYQGKRGLRNGAAPCAGWHRVDDFWEPDAGPAECALCVAWEGLVFVILQCPRECEVINFGHASARESVRRPACGDNPAQAGMQGEGSAGDLRGKVRLGASGKPESAMCGQGAWMPKICYEERSRLKAEREAFYEANGRVPDRSKGQEAMRRRWEWVADHYSKMLEQAENDEVNEILSERSIAMCELGRYREGLNDALNVLKEGKPSSVEDRWALKFAVARCRLGLKRYEESKEGTIKCWTEATEHKLQDVTIRMLGAKAHTLVDDLLDLIEQQWVEFKSADGEEAKGKGNEAFKGGDFDSAIAHYTDALMHRPQWAVVWANRCCPHPHPLSLEP